MAKRKANSKAKREPIGLHLFRLPPPEWKTAEDAREFLDTGVSNLALVLEDLINSGVGFDAWMVRDFAELVQAAAAFMETPGPLDVDDQRLDLSAAADLAQRLERFDAATDGQTIIGSNPHNEVDASTLEVLQEWLLDAVRAQGTEVRAKREHRDAEIRAEREWREARAGAEAGQP